MNATPPEAKSEYSRGQGRSSRPSSGSSGRDSEPARGRSAAGQKDPNAARRRAATAILAGGLLGALLLLIAEFMTLFEVRSAANGPALRSVGTGSHHTFALVPIALLVAALSYGVWTTVSRPALLAIGILGVIALLIALLGDLPDAHASGLIGGGATQFRPASATPSAGLYMETLGAVVLLITSVCGFLLVGPASGEPRAQRHSSGSAE